MKKHLLKLILILLAFVLGVGLVYAAEHILTFETLAVDYTFDDTNQAYEHLGITIGGDGVPLVINNFMVPYWNERALQNDPAPGSEFGSAWQDLEIAFSEFTAYQVRVHAGKKISTYPITATLTAWMSGTLVASDTHVFPLGQIGPVAALTVDKADGGIDRVILSYGGSENSEIIDDVQIQVWEGPPPPPPEDTTPPVVHITVPADGDTTSSQYVGGYVNENAGLESSVTVVTPVETRDFGLLEPTLHGGTLRYPFGGWIDFQEGANEIQVTARDLAGNEHTATVNVTYEAPVDPPPPTSWPDTLDIVVGESSCTTTGQDCGMEVTQVIQGWEQIGPTPYYNDNETSLVAGKKTLVRVYAEVLGVTTDVPGVNCQLQAYVGGVELPGSPLDLATTDRVTLVPGETYLQQRPHADKSFNFILPPEWTAEGTIELVATVNPYNSSVVEGPGNYDGWNTVRNDVTFHGTGTLCLMVYPYRLSSESNISPPWPDCTENIARAQQIYPIEPDNFVVALADRLVVDLPLVTDDDLSTLLTDFRRFLGFYYGVAHAAPCINTVYLGLTHSSDTHRGIASGDFPVALSVASTSDYYRMKTAHETGHVLGLDHVQGDAAHGCGSPAGPYETYPVYRDAIDGEEYFAASIGDWGVDIRDDNSFRLKDPADVGDMMSYCDDRWMSEYIWEERLGGIFIIGAASAAASPESAIESLAQQSAPYLTINGSIGPAGTATLDPAWTQMLPEGSSDHVGQGDYTIRLLDGSSTVLFERHFDPSPIRDLEEYAFFHEVMPAEPGTETIELSGGDLPAPLSIEASPGAPVVELTLPAGGEAWEATGSQEVYWTGFDADGDPLLYTLFYSTDDGDTWQVVQAGLQQTSTVVLLDDLPGCQDSCQMQVAASDGINQGNDTSDPFSKEGLPPWATILAPQPTMLFSCGELVIFEGLVGDPEDGTIASGNLVWSSDLDGELGTGLVMGTTGLSAGMHQVTLTATDSDGLQDSDTTALYVAPCYRAWLPIVVKQK